MAKLSILHLYPNSLTLNGESGNLLALKVRAKALGCQVSVSSSEIDEPLPKVRPNLIFLGSGTNGQMLRVLDDLQSKSDQIHKWVAAGSKVLAVGVGFDLISNRIQFPDGKVFYGIQLTNTNQLIQSEYLVGEVVTKNGIAGFINTSRIIERPDLKHEFALVRFSDSKELEGYSDGYRDGKVWASNIQGPLIPMNPKIANEILSSIFGKLPTSINNAKLDRLAKKARTAIELRVGS